jgi:hypothetical protein
LIDPLIDAGLDPKEIWIRIIDEHHIVVPFTPMLNYTKERHASRAREPTPLPSYPSYTSRWTDPAYTYLGTVTVASLVIWLRT